MRFGLFIWIACLALASSAMAFPRGVYVAIPASGDLPTQAEWEVPYNRGFSVPRRWSAIETARDTYDWTEFDTLVADAETYNKTVTLGLVVGLLNDEDTSLPSGLPAWYTGGTFTCEGGDIGPQHWDPEYQREYRQIVRDLIMRYDANPRVDAYAFSGWGSWAFVEMSPPCRNTNTATDRAGVIAAGYTRAKIRDFTMAVIQDIRQITRKPVRFGIGRLIDETTALNSVPDTTPYIIEPLKALFQAPRVELPHSPRRQVSQSLGRFAVQRPSLGLIVGKTNLRGGPVEETSDPLGVWNQNALDDEETIVYANRPGFYQTETVGGGGPGAVDSWTQAMDVALHYGVRFVEVRRNNIVNPDLAAILACANAAMRTGGGHCGH